MGFKQLYICDKCGSESEIRDNYKIKMWVWHCDTYSPSPPESQAEAEWCRKCVEASDTQLINQHSFNRLFNHTLPWLAKRIKLRTNK